MRRAAWGSYTRVCVYAVVEIKKWRPRPGGARKSSIATSLASREKNFTSARKEFRDEKNFTGRRSHTHDSHDSQGADDGFLKRIVREEALPSLSARL